MILDSGLKLEAVLAGAIATSQPDFHINYEVWNREGLLSRPGSGRGALNSTTDVTLLAAPGDGYTYEVKRLVIYNKDTASIIVTIKTDDGTTERIDSKWTVTTLKSLIWERNVGWYLTT